MKWSSFWIIENVHIYVKKTPYWCFQKHIFYGLIWKNIQEAVENQSSTCIRKQLSKNTFYKSWSISLKTHSDKLKFSFDTLNTSNHLTMQIILVDRRCNATKTAGFVIDWTENSGWLRNLAAAALRTQNARASKSVPLPIPRTYYILFVRAYGLFTWIKQGRSVIRAVADRFGKHAGQELDASKYLYERIYSIFISEQMKSWGS